MPLPESSEALKWRFTPRGSVIKGSDGRSLSVSQAFWEDVEERPQWQHPRPILFIHSLPPLYPADPSTGHLHFFAHTIGLRLVPSGKRGLWKATSVELAVENMGDSLHAPNVQIGEFVMDNEDFPNPAELVLLCRFESHARMAYFERTGRTAERTGQNQPWDVATCAADVNGIAPSGALGRIYDYAVLVVETMNGIPYRRGVGTVDLSSFWRARPCRKYVVLG